MTSVRPLISRSLQELLEVCSPTDYIFSKMSPTARGATAEYYCWPGVGAQELYEHLASLEKSDRAYHIVCGRPGIPLDFFADLDLRLDPSSKADQDRALAIVEGTITESARLLRECCQKEFERVLVLQSYSTRKFSYHIHARIDESTAFNSILDLRSFAQMVEQSLRGLNNQDTLDLAVYRPGSQLRVFNSVKLIGDTAALETMARRVPETWNPTPASMFEMSLVQRDINEVEDLLQIALTETEREYVHAANEENAVAGRGRFAGGLPATLRYVSFILPNLPDSFANDYHTWISAVLALRSLENAIEEKGLNTNIDLKAMAHDFSSRSPKYDVEYLEKTWSRAKVDADWMRSHNYFAKHAKEFGLPDRI